MGKQSLKTEIRLCLIIWLVTKIISIVTKLPPQYLNIKVWALSFPSDLIKNQLADYSHSTEKQSTT